MRPIPPDASHPVGDVHAKIGHDIDDLVGDLGLSFRVSAESGHAGLDR
jgi:hypothetical protein